MNTNILYTLNNENTIQYIVIFFYRKTLVRTLQIDALL